MKKVLLIVALLISANFMFAQTATLKIGTLLDPAAGTVLVPFTLEAIDNPIIGSNLISSWGWYVAYDASVLNAGAPMTPATLVNYHPQFAAANYLTNIIADNPIPGWNTIAVIYSAAVSGTANPGDKFFDIQFTYVGMPQETDIIWTETAAKGDKSTKFATNMADDEGNEFVLTLIEGFVGPNPIIPGKTWTGAVDNDWFNGGNWSPVGVPTAADDVTIPGSKAIVTISGGIATTAALNVAFGGGITIAYDGGLTTNGLFTNDGDLVIESEVANGYAGSFIDLGGIAGTGTFAFDRQVLCTGIQAGQTTPWGWHYLSAPFDGFTTDGLPEFFVNAWDQPSGMWMQYEGPIGLPCTPIAPAIGLGNMDAWSINLDLDYGLNCGAFDQTANFASGVAGVHTGGYGAGLGYGAAGYQMWNMVGNPYPSGLDLNTIAFGPNTFAAAYFYDGCAGNYVYWATGMGAYSMAPTLGFFVETVGADVLTVNNANRAHNPGWFWKNEVSNLLTLQATGNEKSDVLHVRIADDVTTGLDLNGDAHKLFATTEGLPQIYTLAGEEKLAINAIPETTTVPMGFVANGSGSYTIEAIETSEFENVVLEDLVMGIQTDLLNGSYTFDYAEGDDANRFVIHFSPLGVNELSADAITIWAANQTIYVQAPATTGDIVVYNMMGQEVVRTAINAGLNEIPMNEANTYYIVKVLGSEITETGKVFIK